MVLVVFAAALGAASPFEALILVFFAIAAAFSAGRSADV